MYEKTVMRMKQILSIAALLYAICAAAQTPSTTWPYLYDNFTPGTIYLVNGSKSEVQMNVHLRRDKLHFIDSELVKEADLTGVNLVMIGKDKFVPVEGGVRRVEAENANGYVLASILGDFAAVQETGGAYGSSSSASATRKLSSLDFDTQVGQNHIILMKDKTNGVELRLVKHYYLFLADGICIPATRKDVEAFLPESASANWKAWLKSAKPKWRDLQSLLAVIDYLSSVK